MGISRFRMSQLMSQSWFHKLRVNIRRINCREDSKTEKSMQRTISLPRSGYYQDFVCSGGRGFESPRGPKKKEEKIRMDKNKKQQQAGRKVKAKLLRTKSKNSRPKACPVIEARVSTGCVFRAKVASKGGGGGGGGKIVKKREKNQVLEKNFEIFEMEKVANPCRSVDLTARKRNQGCGKDSSDSSMISFDGALKLRRCSALCCTCKVSFSESFNDSDDSLRDVDFWSEEEKEVAVPFLRNSDGDHDPLVSDMEDLKESAATLFRRGDAATHAQVQAKLSQMIDMKVSKKESKQKNENLRRNRRNISNSVEFQTNEASCGPETASESYSFQKKSTGGDAQGRAKIDRGGSKQRGCWKPTDENVVQNCKSEDKFASKGMRKISESFAIVKSSYDPRRDFTESMVEMIVENEIRNSHELWELLRCYISLNSEEYREIIFEVFEQVCSELLRVNA